MIDTYVEFREGIYTIVETYRGDEIQAPKMTYNGSRASGITIDKEAHP